MDIKEILSAEPIGKTIEVRGWVRTFRSNRFIALNDGSGVKNLQVVVDFETESPELLKRITTGACLQVTGEIAASQGRGQTVEMFSTDIKVLGDSDPD
ncbi:MAG: asparagine--tRNA ligase, partial [Flavobacteriales bacterium]|nr:asparagine--tRNA ligase [Flavobacteriales bacterium]